MCWGIEVTGAMVALGVGGAAISWRREDPAALPLTMLYFAGMEGLQLAGYLVIDRCGTPQNQAVTALSMLHIILQPVVLTLFMLAAFRPDMGGKGRAWIIGLSILASAVMLAQMVPWPWTTGCTSGRPLCGTVLCTVSGTWHLAWDVPYGNLLETVDLAVGTNFGFPSYFLAVFVMPLFYGAWRFALFNMLVGPVASNLLTRDPNEAPAVWCLTAIFILGVVLMPGARQLFGARPAKATGSA